MCLNARLMQYSNDVASTPVGRHIQYTPTNLTANPFAPFRKREEVDGLPLVFVFHNVDQTSALVMNIQSVDKQLANSALSDAQQAQLVAQFMAMIDAAKTSNCQAPPVVVSNVTALPPVSELEAPEKTRLSVVASMSLFRVVGDIDTVQGISDASISTVPPQLNAEVEKEQANVSCMLKHL